MTNGTTNEMKKKIIWELENVLIFFFFKVLVILRVEGRKQKFQKI